MSRAHRWRHAPIKLARPVVPQHPATTPQRPHLATTTFSASSLETLRLLEDGKWPLAFIYVAASVFGALAAVWLVRASREPSAAQPAAPPARSASISSALKPPSASTSSV